MQEKFTFRNGGFISATFSFLMIFGLLLTNSSANAQIYCANETVIYSENFGTGWDYGPHPDVVNIQFSPTFALEDGFYRVINNTQQRGEWHNSGDHTPNTTNGKMLVINGQAGDFFVHTITNGSSGFLPGSYAASLFLMNTNTPGTCAPDPLLPTITFKVEYNASASGNTGWVSLQNVTATSVPQSANPTWIQLGGVFNLPNIAQRVRLTLSDATNSGCGNDFAIDDIKFATCPEGGPLPVKFLNINASLQGAGVAVNWSTASESNNKYFDIEKSTDGSNWKTINSLNAGTPNSNITKKYGSYDANPVNGYNYYRIKQVDADGKFQYSDVARVKVTIEKTGVTVLANPFVNNITVDFLSKSKQFVNVRLSDISGKTIATEKWQINSGSTRLRFDNVSNLQRGMYIFTVTDENSNVIYNNKLVKQ